MKQPTKLWPLLAGGLALLLVLTLVFPQTHQSLGSSFSRQPDGYGAWYAYMTEQGHTIERLSQPYDQLDIDQPLTIVQVHYPRAPELSDSQQEWIAQGHRLVILTQRGSATEAPFQIDQDSSSGSVRIETTRRRSPARRITPLLEDEFGVIAWSESEGEGEIITTVTPFLAANAYQDHPANFELLEAWVTEGDRGIWVDEYIHGYRDPELVEGVSRSWQEFLADSALLPVGIQSLVLIGIGILAANRRFGQVLAPPDDRLTNSETYIQALAAVLQKAHSSEFVVETLGKDERIRLQRALGLGQDPLSTPHLLQVWTERIGKPTPELEAFLNPLPISGRSALAGTEGGAQKITGRSHRTLSDAELRQWLQAIQQVRRQTSGPEDPPPSHLSN